MVLKAIGIAPEQDQRDVIQFLEGLGKAFKTGTLTPKGKFVAPTSSIQICLLILHFGLSIEGRFGSVNAFHDFVSRFCARMSLDR